MKDNRLFIKEVLGILLVIANVNGVDRGAFKREATPQTMLGTVIILCLLLLTSIIVFLIRRHQEGKSKKARSLAKFKELVDRRHIEKDEETLLKMVATACNVPYLGELITNRDLFNRSFSAFIESEIPKYKPGRRQETFAHLTAIRKKCSFNQPMPFTPVRTTKEIPINTKISVQVGRKIFRSAVLENIEHYLLVVPPKAIDTELFRTGAPVAITFYRQSDGHYQIRTTMERIIPEPLSAIALAHTSKIKDAVKRKFTRANLSEACSYQVIDKEFFQRGEGVAGSSNKGTVINFSVGGIRVSTIKDIPVESYLKVSFMVGQKYHFDNLKGKLLKKIKSIGEYTYHLKFIGVSEADLTRLSKAVEYASRLESIKYRTRKGGVEIKKL